jgi:SAM-dependent methyltransferase
MVERSSSGHGTYNSAFAEYYDQITSHKDYSAEVEALVALVQEKAPGPAPRILDVGCGTGTHAALLADKGYDVTALDASAEMAAKARLKAPTVKVVSGDIADLNADPFEFACSLFNVINYLESLEALINFFGEIGARLVSEGVLLVEAWNPIAVIAVPPETIERIFDSDAARIRRTVVPHADFLYQRLDLEYEIEVQTDADTGHPKHFVIPHRLVLFTPMEIEFALTRAGFEDVSVRTALPELAAATASDRMLAFTCRRTLA